MPNPKKTHKPTISELEDWHRTLNKVLSQMKERKDNDLGLDSFTSAINELGYSIGHLRATLGDALVDERSRA